MSGRDFLLSTDYPLDKVIGMMSGSRNVPGFAFDETFVGHPFGFDPLPLTVYSYDASFDSAKDEGYLVYADPADQINLVTYTKSGQLRLSWFNNTSTSKTIYWRTYFLMPSNLNEDVSHTAISSDSFVMNTDYNYTKLFMSGVGNGIFEVTHGLGYKPQVIAWSEGDILGISRITISNIAEGNPRVAVTDQKVIFDSAETSHYRIYLDE